MHSVGVPAMGGLKLSGGRSEAADNLSVYSSMALCASLSPSLMSA